MVLGIYLKRNGYDPLTFAEIMLFLKSRIKANIDREVYK